MLRHFRGLRRWVRVALAAGLALIVLAVSGYVALAIRGADTPPPASLGEAPEDGLAAGDTAQFEGRWSVRPGKEDFVGYRMRERLGFVPAPNDAVGRTNDVRGSMTIEGSTLTAAKVTANMQSLRSDAEPRDGTLRNQGLQTDSFPEGTFELAEPVDFGHPRRGKEFRFVAVGDLTLHGVTKRVRFPLDSRWNGATFQLAGSLTIRPADYEMHIDQAIGLHVSERGELELELTFARGGGGSAGTPLPTEADTPAAPARELVAQGEGSLVATLSADEDEGGSLYRLSISGGTRERLTKGGSFLLDEAPSLSPDGSKIAFSRAELTEEGPPPHIYQVNANGTGLRKLTNDPFAVDQRPAWYPDGTRIAFSRGNDPETAIWVMNADGSGERKLSGEPVTPDDSPAWSPDGSMIAYVSFVPGGNEDVFVMNADGSSPRRLTRSPAYDYAPSWSPDGSRIAFGRDGDIGVMGIDGANAVRLTRGSDQDASPRWSPDGERIAFTRSAKRGSFGSPGRIVVMNANGTGAARIVTRGLSATWPEWIPG
jgi:Tol biopolymer transport system component/polyisoprenoid-binding protein YceI